MAVAVCGVGRRACDGPRGCVFDSDPSDAGDPERGHSAKGARALRHAMPMRGRELPTPAQSEAPTGRSLMIHSVETAVRTVSLRALPPSSGIRRRIDQALAGEQRERRLT